MSGLSGTAHSAEELGHLTQTLEKLVRSVGRLSKRTQDALEALPKLVKRVGNLEKAAEVARAAEKPAEAAARTEEMLASQARTIEEMRKVIAGLERNRQVAALEAKLVEMEARLAKAAKSGGRLGKIGKTVVDVTKTGVRWGTGGLVIYGVTTHHMDAKQEKDVKAAAKEVKGEKEEDQVKIAAIYDKNNNGGKTDGGSVNGAWQAFKKTDEYKNADTMDKKLEAFDKWVPKHIKEGNNPLIAVWRTIVNFLTPEDGKMFGPGSLLVGGGLTALGAMLGGAWLAIPLGLLGLVAGQKVLPIGADGVTPAPQTGGGTGQQANGNDPKKETKKEDKQTDKDKKSEEGANTGKDSTRAPSHDPEVRVQAGLPTNKPLGPGVAPTV